MASKNSRLDPELMAAVESTKAKMVEVAATARVALDEYITDPWWVELPPGGPPGVKNVFHYPNSEYPLRAWLSEELFEPTKYGKRLLTPTDIASGTRFHELFVWAFCAMLEAGWPVAGYNGLDNSKTQKETPRTFLDRVKRNTRTLWRTDELNIFTECFALLEFKKDGRPREDRAAKVMPGQPLPRVQQWYAEPVSPDSPRMKTNIVATSKLLRELFRRAAIALLPKQLEPDDVKFLRWMKERGGSAPAGEVNQFLTKNKIPGGGQMPRQLVIFCEKEGTPGSTTPWVVFDEALQLLDK